MVIPNWGMLEKSQVDPEKIEPAIDRLIGVHNANEESHLAAGQSLQSHKAAEIIDHLARSVVRDKLKFDKFTIDTHFDTIDIWDKTVGVELASLSEVYFWTTNVTNNLRRFSSNPAEGIEGQGVKAKNPNWESRVKISQITNQIIYLMQGFEYDSSGWGFKIVNGTLYAVYFDANHAEQLEEILGITLTAFNSYRLELVNSVSLKWYVNGVLKKTIIPSSLFDIDCFANFSIQTTENAIKYMHLQSFHFDADYL